MAASFRNRIEPILASRLRAWMDRFTAPPTPEDILAAGYPSAPDADLVAAIEHMLAMAWLLGMDHASPRLVLADGEADPLPFDTAVAFMKARVPLTKQEWRELEPKLRFRAFTVAALSEADGVERVRKRLSAAIEAGTSKTEFWTAIKDEAAASPRYWETVYRTNIQTAYNAGRATEFQREQPEYLEFLGIEDGRQTPICARRTGLVLPATHPFWKTNWPPLHFQCRSTVRAVYKEEMDVDPTIQRSPDEGIPEEMAASGFGGNPLESGSYWMLQYPQIERGIKYGIITELNKMDNVIGDWKELWRGYTRTTLPGGGWLDVPDQKPVDFEKNLPVARTLAEHGYTVKLLPEFKNTINPWKNPDLFIDGVLADIKQVETMTKRAVESRLRSANAQNLTTVVIKIPPTMDTRILYRGLKGYFAQSGGRLNRVVILFDDRIVEVMKDDLLKLDSWPN